MVDRTYRVHLTTATVQHVIASTVQIHGDHLVFLDSKGKLAALFSTGLVRSWNILPNATKACRCRPRTMALIQRQRQTE
jgi:hypothetical protein